MPGRPSTRAVFALAAVACAAGSAPADVAWEAAQGQDDECAAGAADCALSAVQLRGDPKLRRARDLPPGFQPGRFISSKDHRDLEWTSHRHSVQEMLDTAPKWSDRTFADAPDQTITKARLKSFIEDELLNDHAFGGNKVPVPWPAADGDQIGEGNWVGYSRRQVCFIVAKAMLGSTPQGYENGLTRFMAGCPRKGDFGQSMVTLLASCAADPTLANGGQGPLILAARAGAIPSVSEARNLASHTPLSQSGLRVCQYDDGAPPLSQDVVPVVPSEGCRPPSDRGVGADFMTGGLFTQGKAQATQDISAGWLGGYIFGNVCGLGGGQDERLMVYFPEVAALTFFLSGGAQFPQLRQPAWVLGARSFFTELDGTARFDDPLLFNPRAALTSDLKVVEVAGESFSMSSSRPFLAFMSESQGLVGAENRWSIGLARRNKHPLQRLAGDEAFAFEKQVRAWYRSVALTSYADAVRPALRTLVGSIGTGPWGAGLWWGDSQLDMLAVWIGQAIAAPTWGNGGDQAVLPVDYYIYSAFTENPGNQCFVHSRWACQACGRRCSGHPLPGSAFWLPDYGFLLGGRNPCVDSPGDCGEHGLEDIIRGYKAETAGKLWSDVENAIRGKGPERSVFDLMLQR